MTVKVESKVLSLSNGTIALWAVAIVSGIGLMFAYDYQARPTDSARAKIESEADGVLSPIAGRSTLLFFAHPKCPCTRASVEELAKLMSECPEIVAYGVVVIPSGVGADFGRGAAVDALKGVPNIRIIEDKGSLLANKYNAHTSGQTLFYDREGKLVFNGGITFARGHVGDNQGRTKIVSLAKHTPGFTDKAQSTPVFGCGLRNDGEAVLCAKQEARKE